MADVNNGVDVVTAMAAAIQQSMHTQEQLGAVVQRLAQTNENSDAKLDIRVLPTFRGRIGEDNVDKFLDQMERAFNAFNVQRDRRRVFYTANQLQGTASNWWFARRSSMTAEQEAALTWTEFKTQLIQQFKPLDFNLLLRDKLNNLHQTGSVDGFTNIFVDLSQSASGYGRG